MPSDACGNGHASESAAVEEACAQARVDSRGLYLMRRHANAIYHLPRAGAVARIRDIDAIAALSAAVQTTRWLTDQDFPAAEPLDIDQPIAVGSFAVTFWRYLPASDDQRPTSADLAARLRRLHQMPIPPFALPPTQPLGSTRRQAARSLVLSDMERRWLVHRCNELMDAYSRIAWVLRPGIVHGDAHTNNLLPHPRHSWVLIDWDSVSIGPPEYDFMPIYIRPRRFGYPPDTWRDFVTAYGTDLSGWPDLETLAQIREVRSLAAYIRNAPTNETARRELANRLGSLMNDDRTRRWHAS
jgi:aminoglycoside phosphotransferase (APT) family kinase protein